MDTTPSSAESNAIPIEQMIALNNEIIALVRAGVPLELGLAELGEEGSGALSRISSTLAERMSRGESLLEALAAVESRCPVIYRTVVEAGIRAGQLPTALEGMSRYADALVDLRNRIAVAVFYPLLVTALAYGLFIVFLDDVTKRFQDTYHVMRLPMHGAMRILSQLGETLVLWAWIPPLGLVVLLLWWSRTGGTQLLRFSGIARPLGWIPGMKRIGFNYRCANFADLLALLVQHQVPLDEAIVLAADATGEASLQTSARAVAEATRAGTTMEENLPGAERMPPYLRWLLTRGKQQDNLVRSLQRAAETYRRKAVHQTEWLKLGFPVLACIVIGGGATSFYALALFLPLVDMLKELAI